MGQLFTGAVADSVKRNKETAKECFAVGTTDGRVDFEKCMQEKFANFKYPDAKKDAARKGVQ
jgi:hypothetical protein